MSQRALLFTFCTLTVAACSNAPFANMNDNDAQGLGTSNVDMTMVQLPPNTKLVHLLSSNYDLQPGTEGYQCQRITVPKDLYILKITPISPTGVHHEVLAIDPGGKPDGVTSCGPLERAWRPFFASGVGSPSLEMPKGVAFKLVAGTQIVLNLHLFNAQPGNLKGTAAIDVVAAETDMGYQPAAMPFVGPLMFQISASRTVSGSCTLSNDTTLFGVFPHMHISGKHLKVTAGKIGSETLVWDDDYDFNDQKFGRFPNWKAPETVALKKGEKINVTCTYDATGVGKSFGDSTTDEMCFGMSWLTPPINTTGGTPFCAF